MTLPFFVLHGEADTVTDPEVSKALYDQASSKDKTIKLYRGMWHGLTSGEPDSNIEIVFSDIMSWLDKRSSAEANFDTTTQKMTFKSVHQQHSPIMEKLNTMPSPLVQVEEEEKPNGIENARGKYLCGWNGRRMHHQSSM